MGLTANTLEKVTVLAAPAGLLLLGALVCDGTAAALPTQPELANEPVAVSLQTDQEPPTDDSLAPMTKAERKELERIQREAEARAKAEAKQARRLEKQKQEEEAADSAPMTRAERKELKRQQAEAEALAKAEAKQARQLENQMLEEEKASNKAEKRRSRQRDVRIESLEIEERDDEARLTIRTSEEPEWQARQRPGGGIVLQLSNTVPGRRVAPLVQREGIVASVDLWRGDEGESAIEIEIATRVRVTAAVGPIAGGLLVRLQRAEESSDSGRRSGASSDGLIPISPSEFNATLQNSEYQVGAGDLLAIEIFGLPELSRGIRVEANGTVNFPVLGAVELAGLSLREAEAKLVNLLSGRGLVTNPVVAIVVEEFLSRGVSVQGAVNRPGVYQLLGPKTLLDLLAETGGLSGGELAGKKIYVLRSVPDRGQLRTEIDAERLFEHGDLAFNVGLQPGDIIQVPQPQRVRVYLSGAVRTPGPIDYLSSERMTLLQAISSAGGPTERARLGAVQVIRRYEDGTEERFEVDLNKIRKGKLEDFVLQRGDTVVLKEWLF